MKRSTRALHSLIRAVLLVAMISFGANFARAKAPSGSRNPTSEKSAIEEPAAVKPKSEKPQAEKPDLKGGHREDSKDEKRESLVPGIVEPSARAIGLYIENDARTVGGPGSDQSYSNGFRVSYVHAQDKVPAWARWLTESSEIFRRERDKALANFGMAWLHQIYTPEQTKIRSFIPDDRPYAAWMAISFMINLRTAGHGQVFDVSVGMIGPSAMGEKVQNEFHRIIARPPTEGWAHQLANEPTLQLTYQQRLRFVELRRGANKYFDAIPYFGGSFGNVSIAGHVGGIARLGTRIPDDLGPTRPSSSDGDSFLAPAVAGAHEIWSLYGFVGARGNAVAHDIFLDGNSFRAGPRVTKYPIVVETEFGLGLQREPLAVIWRFVTRSPEFQERGRFNSFGSFSLSYSFR